MYALRVLACSALAAAALWWLTACQDAARQNVQAAPPTTAQGKVRIVWRTESSQGLYGFNIHRGSSAEGPWACLTTAPILAEEGGTTNIPQTYEFMDTQEIVVGQTYWYWLEAVNADGTKERAWWPPKAVAARVRIDEEYPALPPL